MSSPFRSPYEYIDRKTLEEDVITLNGQLIDARLEVARLREALRAVVETLEGEPGGSGKAIGIAAEALDT